MGWPRALTNHAATAIGVHGQPHLYMAEYIIQTALGYVVDLANPRAPSVGPRSHAHRFASIRAANDYREQSATLMVDWSVIETVTPEASA